MKYRPEIDGLRAIAVIVVVLFHCEFNLFSGGFIGVDVFFVISGYLISSIILSELKNNKFSITNFYVRRIRRLLPILYFIILIFIPIGYYLLLPAAFEQFGESISTVSIFCSNILFWSQTGYFDDAAISKPFLHSWSLSIEEQYYIAYPIFLYLIFKYSKKDMLKIIFSLFIISLLFAIYCSFNHPNFGFFFLPSRVWELLIGALTAININLNSKLFIKNNHNQILSALGFIGIILSIIIFDSKTYWPSYNALLPTLSTSLIIIFSNKNTLVYKILSLKPLVKIGLISYSLYLWHYPILSFSKHYFEAHPYLKFNLKLINSIICMLSLILAYFSWKYIENTFRDKNKLKSKPIIISSIIISSIFFSLGLSISNGMIKQKFSVYDKYENKIGNYEFDRKLLKTNSWKDLRRLAKNNNYRHINNKFDNTLWYDTSDVRKKILIVGNSHGKDMYNILKNSQTALINFQIARFGTHFKKTNDKIFSSPNYSYADIVMISSRLKPIELINLEFFIKKVKEDKKVIVLLNNIFNWEKSGMNSRIIKLVHNRDLSFIDIQNKINEIYANDYLSSDFTVNKQLQTISEKYDIIFLDRMEYTQINGKFSYIGKNLGQYFFDGHHHSLLGVQVFASNIDKINWLKPLFLH